MKNGNWISAKLRFPIMLAQFLVYIEKPCLNLAYYDVLTFLPDKGKFSEQHDWVTYWQPLPKEPTND